jgi:hypothetical protein
VDEREEELAQDEARGSQERAYKEVRVLSSELHALIPDETVLTEARDPVVLDEGALALLWNGRRVST